MATVDSCFTWLRRWPTAKSNGLPSPLGRFFSAYRHEGPGIIARIRDVDSSPPGPKQNLTIRKMFEIADQVLPFLRVSLVRHLSFPLNRAGRFRTDVVYHPINSIYFIDNTR